MLNSQNMLDTSNLSGSERPSYTNVSLKFSNKMAGGSDSQN